MSWRTFNKSFRLLSKLGSIQFSSRVEHVFSSKNIRYKFISLGTGACATLTVGWAMKKLHAKEVECMFLAETITPKRELEKHSSAMSSRMENMIMEAQAKIVRGLEKYEPSGKFFVDRWERPEGGGGISCVLQDGEVLEKAGVNVSVVGGPLPEGAQKQMRARGKDFGQGPLTFKAMGISSVIHPRNPHIPTLHFNYRYFEVTNGKGEKFWWFGGGTDLTPYYLDENDVRHFHQTLKNVCDRHDKGYYGDFKAWCDRYFYNEHRYQHRGVGGIFFDDLTSHKGPDAIFAFVKDCAAAVLPCYIPLVAANHAKGYGYRERDWQLVRRGHYAEFNLIYDRGTKFGLATPGARYESILMSLPLNARWYYCHKVEPGSEEERLSKVLSKARDWV